MLTWLDGRNASSFQGVAFNGGRLSFSVGQAGGATGLQAMLPASGPTGALQGLTRNGQPVAVSTQTIKGITYATFPADAGAYVATYPAPAAQPPAGGGGGGQDSSKTTPKIATVQVLPKATSAPTFPRVKLSAQRFRPGAGRSLAITFRLKRTSRVVLTFRTTKGKIVRRIRTPKRYKAGTVLRLRWDGRDAKGRYVKPGTYRFTLTASGTRYQRTARGSVRVLAAG
jgi:flagellar hook capping protein FlgD